MSRIRLRIAACLTSLLIASTADAVDKSVSAAAAKMSPDREALTGSVNPDAAPCELIPPPPRRIETRSKYDQAFKSKSVIDEQAAELRRQALDPINEAIRRLDAIAATTSTGNDGDSSCVARNVTAWAARQALTDMATSDANLTRDRFMAKITAIIDDLERKNVLLSRDRQVRYWLQDIGEQTIAYYDLQAGPTSRRNNHRYWAGLAVARIGRILDDEHMLSWAVTSLDVGLCQVDANGFLPLELARQTKALDYHLFAYSALRPLHDLLQAEGHAEPGKCASGLARLQTRVETGLKTSASFEQATGYRQDPPSRTNRLAIAQMSAGNAGLRE